MDVQQQFEQFLKRSSLKYTHERQQIFRAIVDFDEPFDVDQLLFYLKQRGEKTSKATIYRTLQLLLESGMLRNISLSPTNARSMLYSLCGKFRAYDVLVCTGCGKVTEIEKQPICLSCQVITKEHGYKLESHSLRIFALCPQCQNQGTSSGYSVLST